MAQDKTREKIFFQHVIDSQVDTVFGEKSHRLIRQLYRDNMPPDQSAIDLGCGTGGFTRVVAGHNRRTIYFDLHLPSVRKARELSGPGADLFLVGDVEKLPFRDGIFASVSMFGLLHHFTRHENIISELSRIMTPGGRFFAFEKSMRHPCVWLFRHPGSPFHSKDGESANERPLWPGRIAADFAVREFAVRLIPVSGLDFVGHYSKLARRWLWLLNLGEYIFSQSAILNRYFSHHFIIIGTKLKP